MRRRKGTLAHIVVLPAILLGCGEGSETSAPRHAEHTAMATSSEDHDVELAIEAYFIAPSATEVCDKVTVGFVALMRDAPPPEDPTIPAGEDCSRTIESAVKSGDFVLEPTEVEIQAVAVDGDAAAVRILNEEMGPEPYGVFLFDSGGRWLVHSEEAVLPGFDDLWDEVRAP